MQNRLDNIPEVQDRVWIATIHSVAQGILEKYGHLIGLPKDLHIYENDRDRMEMFIKSLREGGIDIDKYLNIENKDERKKVDKILKDYMSAFSKIKRTFSSAPQPKPFANGRESALPLLICANRNASAGSIQ